MKLLASYPGSSAVEEPGYEAIKQQLSMDSRIKQMCNLCLLRLAKPVHEPLTDQSTVSLVACRLLKAVFILLERHLKDHHLFAST